MAPVACFTATQRAPHHLFTVLSPKVLGIATARYDFCARDMRELSLLKGDVVKIYTKMSGNGWWRGEVNGKVSCPSRRACGRECRGLGSCWPHSGTGEQASSRPRPALVVSTHQRPSGKTHCMEVIGAQMKFPWVSVGAACWGRG